VHSLSDFGQHVPANAALSTVFCALLVRLSRMDAEPAGAACAEGSKRPVQSAWVAALALTVAVGGWTLSDANAARVAAAHWDRATRVERELVDRQWQGSDDEYTKLLACAAQAQDCDPGNVKYRYWLNTFRWRAISQLVDPNADRSAVSVRVREFAERIAGELNLARALCPTYGPSWTVLGQLEKYVLDCPDAGAGHIRTGVRLAPCDATAHLVAATLEAEDGDVEPTMAHLQRAVALDARMFDDAVTVLIGPLDRPDLALQIAGEDVHRLARVALILERSGGDRPATTAAGDKVLRLLEDSCRKPDASEDALGALARIYARNGRTRLAIEYYRRLLTLAYGDVESRFNLAKLLVETQSWDEAMQQARICVRLRPEFAMARQLIEDISRAAPAGIDSPRDTSR
jgi:tetratricopeptide (TPR) repeat protein